MLPFLFGIMVPIVLGSLAIVSWAIAMSKPAPEADEADELLHRLRADTETDVEKTKSDSASAEKSRKVG